ncbi:hypothetical protein ABZP36_024577 [Zizania latifolia]
MSLARCPLPVLLQSALSSATTYPAKESSSNYHPFQLLHETMRPENLLASLVLHHASAEPCCRHPPLSSNPPDQPDRTKAEIDAYLAASSIRERAIQRITDVIGTYNDLRDRIFSKHSDLFREEVRLPSMDEKVALVPWADMLNHSPEVETFLDYNKSSRGIVFTTDHSYQPGEQVFISYGKKSSGELLLSYGFVLKEGTNPNNSVELLVSLNKSDKCYEEKVKVLKKNGLKEQVIISWKSE